MTWSPVSKSATCRPSSGIAGGRRTREREDSVCNQSALSATPAVETVGDASRRRARRRNLAACWIVLLLAALVVRLRTFTPLEVGLDGALSMDLARSPAGEMLRFNALDVHPPLFYLALKAWMLAAGAGYFQAKYLAIASSLLSAALLGAVATRVRSPGTGLLAAILLTLAPTNVLLGTTVRDFAPGLAISLLCLALALEFRAGRAPERGMGAILLPVALAAATGAALLTWYFHAAFYLLTVGLVVTLPNPRRVPGVAALAAGVVLASPWYAFAIPALLGKVERGTTAFGGPPQRPSPSALVDALAHGLTGQNGPIWGVVTLGIWLALCLLGVLAWAMPQACRAATSAPGPARTPAGLGLATAVSGLALGVVEIAGLVARWNAPSDSSRYALALVPFAAVLQSAAAATARPAVRWMGLAGLLVILAWNEASYVRLVSGTPIDWSRDPALAEVRQQMRPGDAVIFNDRARRLRFALGPHPGVDAYVVHSAGQSYLQAGLRDDAEQVVGSAVRSARRIWCVNAGDPPNTPPFVLQALAARAFVMRRDVVDGTNLSLWGVGRPDGATTPMAVFGGAAVLREARFSSTASPGGDVLVDLTWDSVQALREPYTVFVHMEDAEGKLVAQHDGEPGAGFLPTTSWRPGTLVDDRHGVLVSGATAPGTYRLTVGLYRGDRRLSLPDGANQLVLGVVRVV